MANDELGMQEIFDDPNDEVLQHAPEVASGSWAVAVRKDVTDPGDCPAQVRPLVIKLRIAIFRVLAQTDFPARRDRSAGRVDVVLGKSRYLLDERRANGVS